MKFNARALPLAGFALLFALLAFGIWFIKYNSISVVPSPLIGKPAPAYSLPMLYEPDRRVDGASFRGKPYLLHVFASWCYVCREENPVLMTEGKRLGIPLVGFNYKDEPAEARLWLARYGDPYDLVIADVQGGTAIDFGVYGAPEAFLIDGRGMIRYKYVGALTGKVIRDEIKPVLDQLRKETPP
jgi:cytochrome c biogenesis protein CcmG/thiol:disulfide interchange protein DsbE